MSNNYEFVGLIFIRMVIWKRFDTVFILAYRSDIHSLWIFSP